ncbi:MAG: cytochrome C oxidase subunit IV family protein [Verrucomicrobiota bacterium]
MAGDSHPSYGKIYIWLLVLFVISVAGPEIAEIAGMEGASRVILVLTTAFGIALVKAYMVLAYFMHLKFEKIYAPYILLACTSLLFVFFFGTATDVMKPEGHNWNKDFDESAVKTEAVERVERAKKIFAGELDPHAEDDHGDHDH